MEQKKVGHFWRRGNFPAWVKMLVAVAVVLLFVLIFFRVSTFEVTGNVRYTAQEVAEASGVSEGDFLLSVNKTRTAGRLLTRLPYVETVKLSKVMPGILRIEIEECGAAVMAQSEFSTPWLLSENGKLLEELETADEAGESGYPVIKGPSLTLPVAGDQAEFDDPQKGEKAMELLGEIKNVGLGGMIKEIDVSDLQNITLLFEDRIQVRLGQAGDVAYQMRYLKTVISQLDANARGVLDLSFSAGDQAVFHPVG